MLRRSLSESDVQLSTHHVRLTTHLPVAMVATLEPSRKEMRAS